MPDPAVIQSDSAVIVLEVIKQIGSILGIAITVLGVPIILLWQRRNEATQVESNKKLEEAAKKQEEIHKMVNSSQSRLEELNAVLTVANKALFEKVVALETRLAAGGVVQSTLPGKKS